MASWLTGLADLAGVAGGALQGYSEGQERKRKTALADRADKRQQAQDALAELVAFDQLGASVVPAGMSASDALRDHTFTSIGKLDALAPLRGGPSLTAQRDQQRAFGDARTVEMPGGRTVLIDPSQGREARAARRATAAEEAKRQRRVEVIRRARDGDPQAMAEAAADDPTLLDRVLMPDRETFDVSGAFTVGGKQVPVRVGNRGSFTDLSGTTIDPQQIGSYHAPPQGGGPDFLQANALRDEFNTHMKDHQTLANSYRKVVAGASGKSAASDMSLIFGFMRLQDPTSTVREGEYATAQNAGSWSDSMRNLYNRAISDGQKLQPGQRAQFVAAAKGLVESQREAAREVSARYTGLANLYGVNPAKVVYDPYAQFDAPPNGGASRNADRIRAGRGGQ